MKIIKNDIDLKESLRIREEEIVVIDGLAEELYEKFTSDDPRIYGALSESIMLPEMMIKLIFGNLDLFNTLLTIQKEYNMEYDEEKEQVLLSLKEELRK